MENAGPFRAKVNGHFEFENLSLDELDIIPIKDNQFHILYENRSFQAEVVEPDFEKKSFRIKINSNFYEVVLKDTFDQLIQQLGFSSSVMHKVKDIKAPMPGLVLEIVAEVGQQVNHGDPLLILEAMKMENVIKSPGEGTIKIIHVAKGLAVEKGFLLIEME